MTVKYNKLTLTNEFILTKNDPKFKCICDCGNIVYVEKFHVVKGNVKSCGCFKSEMLKRRFRRKALDYYDNDIL